MARTAATIEAEIDALRAAMAKGILRVRHGDTETTYQDVGSMRAVVRDLQAELDELGSNPIRQIRFSTRKGF